MNEPMGQQVPPHGAGCDGLRSLPPLKADGVVRNSVASNGRVEHRATGPHLLACGNDRDSLQRAKRA